MKNLIFDVFESKNVEVGNSYIDVKIVSSCRGWSRIRFTRLVKMQSCRGWSRICLYRA